MTFRHRRLIAAIATALPLLPLAGYAVARQTRTAAFDYWSAADLKSYSEKLAPKLNEKKLGFEMLGKYGNHAIQITLRHASGEAEIHEKQNDVFIVQAGRATLVLGGEMVDGKTTTPGEIRGPSIKGGERRELSAGDVVHISPNVAHQLLLRDGDTFTYAVVKIDK